LLKHNLKNPWKRGFFNDKWGKFVCNYVKKCIILDKNINKIKCIISNVDCNFEIDAGIKIATDNYLTHTVEWKVNQIYFIRCKDYYLNQPNPNSCSIIVKASDLTSSSN
jgi:hypothetical protein